ncbi:MAG: chemotaxis protein CheA [Nitrospinota bacterium]
MSDEENKEEEGEEEDFDDMDFDMSELIDEYVSGAQDNINGINDGLLTLEKDPSDEEALFDIFRRAHGMKGSALMIGFNDIGEVTHKLEDFLKEFHDNKKPLTSDAADVALAAMDIVAALLEGKKEDQEFTMDIAPIIKTMEKFDFESGESATPAPAAPDAGKKPEKKPKKELADSIRIRIKKADELMMLAGNLLSAKSSISDGVGTFAKITSDRKITHERLVELYKDISNAGDIMSRAVDEMRNAVQNIRLLPVSSLFGTFPRLVRDLSRKLKKKVEFIDSGGETLLDRQILEEMNEPLIHMIRNSLDHGLESTKERKKIKKNEKGTIKLSARNEQGKIIISLSDDGGGINPDKVKGKAVEKGLITEEVAAKMSKQEAQMLIFAPGFSTAEATTDVSGRGVGMDAVKTSVEKLHGAVEIDSDVGKGTTFNIILPLTMASTPVLLVSVGGQTIGMPTAYIQAALRVSQDKIKSDNGDMTLAYREETLPLYFLDSVVVSEEAKPPETKKAFVVIVDTGTKKVSFTVSDIVAQREVVVKPLPTNIQHAEFWVGAAQTAAGQILPVLNIPNVVRACGVGV